MQPRPAWGQVTLVDREAGQVRCKAEYHLVSTKLGVSPRLATKDEDAGKDAQPGRGGDF